MEFANFFDSIFGGGMNNFKTKHNPETLLQTAAKFCSSAAPWVNKDLTKQPNWNFGKWRLMESPLMFLIRNGLILDPNNEPFHWNLAFDTGHAPQLYSDGVWEEFGKSGDFKLPKRKIESYEYEIEKFKKSDLIPSINSPYLDQDNQLNIAKLEKTLEEQLGQAMDNEYEHFAKMKIKLETKWRYGLFCALFLHGYSDKTKSVAYKLFDDMNYSFMDNPDFNSANINLSAINDDFIVQNIRNDRIYDVIVKKHISYENVYFMALLQYARRRGVISTSLFGWVKALDRTLWYALNQTGRAVFSAEAAGAWSHYFAEEAVNKPLHEPYLDIAITGFKHEMTVEGYLKGENNG